MWQVLTVPKAQTDADKFFSELAESLASIFCDRDLLA